MRFGIGFNVVPVVDFEIVKDAPTHFMNPSHYLPLLPHSFNSPTHRDAHNQHEEQQRSQTEPKPAAFWFGGGCHVVILRHLGAVSVVAGR